MYSTEFLLPVPDTRLPPVLLMSPSTARHNGVDYGHQYANISCNLSHNFNSLEEGTASSTPIGRHTVPRTVVNEIAAVAVVAVVSVIPMKQFSIWKTLYCL